MFGLGMAVGAHKTIVQELFDEGLIKTWYRDQPEGWILKSGLWSPFYIQLRPIVSKPSLLRRIGEAMAEVISRECPATSRLLGVAMAGIPISVAASLASGLPAAYTRKTDAKDYGEHSAIEGELKDGDEIVVIDDVVTRFDSKREAIDQVLAHSRKLGIKVRCQTVCVVVNRLQLSEGELESQGVRLLSLVDFTAHGMEELRTFFHDAELDVIGRYFENPDEFQSIEVQRDLGRIGLQI